jgi:outer membrane protein OmpA-like peptidoglycan-associated protein
MLLSLAAGAPVVEPVTPAEVLTVLPSLTGPIGLYRMSTADVGPKNHLRLALHGEYFKSSDFLIDKDSNSRLQGGFAFGFTPHRNLEIFGALLTSSNRNQRPSETGRRDPELMKSFGDLVVGPKVIYPVARGTIVGFELGFKLLSSISDLSFSASSTSVWFGPLVTADLRRLAQLPVRVHANANYYIDNSKNLHDFRDVILPTKEVAMFAYGIAASRFRAAVGVEGIFDKLEVPLSAFAEYHAEVVTVGADGDFASYMPPACSVPGSAVPCKDNRDQHWVTVGLRAQVLKGLTIHGGADLRIRSVGFPYGTPLPPYNVVFGLSYPMDVDAFTRPVIVTQTVEKPVAAPPSEGHVTGVVTSSKGGTPVPGAIVAVGGKTRSRVATDPDGSFQTMALPPGPAELEVSAPNFEPTKVTAMVSVGRPVELPVALTPKIPTGNVRGRVADDRGRGLEAVLRFSGPDNFEAKSDASGLFTAALPAGPYKVKAEAPGFPDKEAQIDVVAAQDKQVDFLLRNRPLNPNVSFTNGVIMLRNPIRFRPGAPKLDARAQAGLDGVADILEDHPEIRSLRVEAHWGAGAAPAAKQAARELTGRQAGAIKEYLVKKGVPDARIEAVGVGADKPLVPNIGPTNLAKNRRVELQTMK